MIQENKTIELSAVVPVFNERESVTGTVEALKQELSSLTTGGFEIIAVNDGSTDGSFEILNQIQNIKVISHDKNKGYGASLKSGINKAQGVWILIMDADGTYSPADIAKLWAKKGGADHVIGSRQKEANAIPLERKLAKRFLNRFASYLSGTEIPDLNSGMRIFKKEIALRYWSLFPEKFSFTSTMTMITTTRGYKTIFCPIEYHKRIGKSSIKPSDFVSFIKLVTKLSLFFKPIKVFVPMSLFMFFLAALLAILFFAGVLTKFFDTTFIVLCATALQTLFFGLLAEIIVHQHR